MKTLNNLKDMKDKFLGKLKKAKEKTKKQITAYGMIACLSLGLLSDIDAFEVRASSNISTESEYEMETETQVEESLDQKTIDVSIQEDLIINTPEIISEESSLDTKVYEYEITNSIESNNLEIELAVAETIDSFCAIYELDTNIVYQKAKEITNNFTSNNFVNNNFIEGTVYPGEEEKFETQEAGLLCFVRSISVVPENFNLNLNEIKSDSTYEFEGCFEDMVQKYCDILNYNPVPVLGIAYTECGKDLSSNAFQNKNNPSGTMQNGKLRTFSSLDDGVIYTILNLKHNYGDYNSLGLSEFAEKTGSKYCTEGTSNWVNNFTYFASTIESDIYSNSHYIASNNSNVKTI